MRKFLLWAFLFSLGTSWLAAQTITVTSPTGGDSWCPGTPHTITWTKTGRMQATVAIRLRAADSPESAPAVVTIANGEANDGSFPWTVPASVAPGEYFIRVRTDDSTVIGDSPVFKIPRCVAMTVILPPIDPCIADRHANTDLRLENVLFRIDPRNPNIYHYEFWIRNVGPRCINTLSWKMVTTDEMRGCLLRQPMGRYDASGGGFVLRAGEYKAISGKLVKDVDIHLCALNLSTNEPFAMVKIIIDPSNDVIETNEHNNETLGTECPGSWRVGSGGGFFKLYFNYEGD